MSSKNTIEAKVDRLLNAGSLEPIRGELASLTVEELAALLTKAGNYEISAAQVRRDIQDGAPVNQDGTISFLEYSAWSVKERAHAN